MELPENFDSNIASRYGRVDGDEGVWVRKHYYFCSCLRTIDKRQWLISAKKRGVHAPQAQVYQLHQHKHLVSFRPKTVGLRVLGIPFQGFNSSA